MKILFLLFIVSTLNFTRANVFEEIAKDPNLSKFVQYSKSFSSKFDFSEYLTVFVPNNEAFNLNSDAVDKEIYLKHLVQGNQYVGTLNNLSHFTDNKQSASNTMLIISVNTHNLFVKVGQDTYVNQGKVVSPNHVVNRQCYHVIDRVLTEQVIVPTLQLITKENQILNIKFSKSSSIFAGFFNFNVTDVGKYGLTTGEISGVVPYSWFIPVDDAWQNISASDYNSMLSNYSVLTQVVNNYFVNQEALFLGSHNFTFKMGKVQAETKYTWKDNKGYITLNSYVAEIVKPNIAINYGVVHFISRPLISFETVQQRLDTIAKELMNDLTSVFNNTSQLFTKNASVVILSDENLNALNKLSPEAKREILLSLFVYGLNDSSPSGTYRTMATNSSIVYFRRVDDQNKYLEYPEDTPTRVRSVLKITGSAKLIGGSVFTVEGNLGPNVASCVDRLLQLDRSSFNKSLERLSIKLDIGSPYAVFAPSNEALAPLLSFIDTTTAMPTTTTTTAMPTTTISTVTPYSSNFSTTTLAPQSTTLPATIQTNKLVQFILQRLMFPLQENFDIWLSYPENKLISIPTMNYAAIKERVEILRDPNGATVTYKTKTHVIRANQVGYRCYGSDKHKDERSRDLTIYPVEFILNEDEDKTNAEIVCLVPPCAACFVRSNWLVTLVAVGISYIVRQLVSIH